MSCSYESQVIFKAICVVVRNFSSSVIFSSFKFSRGGLVVGFIISFGFYMASQVLGSNSGAQLEIFVLHVVNHIEKAVPNTHCACVGTIAPSPSVMRERRRQRCSIK